MVVAGRACRCRCGFRHELRPSQGNRRNILWERDLSLLEIIHSKTCNMHHNIIITHHYSCRHIQERSLSIHMRKYYFTLRQIPGGDFDQILTNLSSTRLVCDQMLKAAASSYASSLTVALNRNCTFSLICMLGHPFGVGDVSSS